MKQCYTLVTWVLLCTALSFSSSFAQVFWSEDFSDGFPSGGWINDGPALWMPCDDPLTCPPNVYGPNDIDPGYGTFQAPTADNGYVFYNSFSWADTHQGVLRTPSIDISEQETIFLEFYTHIATNNKNPEDNALLQIITPEETLTFKVFPGLWDDSHATPTDFRVNFDLTPFLEGVNSIALQWYWNGVNEFSWSIDDITLSNNDLTLPPNTCWSERFAFGMEGWTTTNPSEPDAVWEWMLGGDISPAYFNDPGDVIHSPTSVDGAAVYNAEYILSGGALDQLMANYHFLRSDLISPPIDLTCVENTLELHYSQLIKKANPAPNAPLSAQLEKLTTSISWSINGGDTWSTPIDASPDVDATFSPSAPFIEQRIIVPLPPELLGVSDVRLKFTWSGDLFFWVIDDIVICERLPYNMQVNNNFFAIMPNAMTPFGQVGNVGFLADLTNVGYQTATGVNLDLNITHDVTGETIYNDELNFPIVASDELIENVFFEEQLNDQNISRTGPYHGTYHLTQDSVDGRPENDMIKWPFVISDSTFAKELGPTRNITAADTDDFTYGNCFFIPHGEGKYARWITVGIDNVDSLAVDNAEISTFFYKWEDVNDNSIAEPEEYEFVESNRGFNSYQFNTMEDDQGYITLPIHFEGDGIPLEDSTYYLVAVQYISSNGRSCTFMASEQFNYQATTFVSDSLQQNRYSSILDLNNTGTFDFIGFGLGVVPVVRLHIGDTADLSVPGIIVSNNQEPRFDPESQLDIYPNPNNGQFVANLKLQNLSKYVGIKLLNMSGSLLFSKKIENIKENQFNLSFPTIPPGTYLLQVQTDHQVLSKKIAIVRQ